MKNKGAQEWRSLVVNAFDKCAGTRVIQDHYCTATMNLDLIKSRELRRREAYTLGNPVHSGALAFILAASNAEKPMMRVASNGPLCRLGRGA